MIFNASLIFREALKLNDLSASSFCLRLHWRIHVFLADISKVFFSDNFVYLFQFSIHRWPLLTQKIKSRFIRIWDVVYCNRASNETTHRIETVHANPLNHTKLTTIPVSILRNAFNEKNTKIFFVVQKPCAINFTAFELKVSTANKISNRLFPYKSISNFLFCFSTTN